MRESNTQHATYALFHPIILAFAIQRTSLNMDQLIDQIIDYTFSNLSRNFIRQIFGQ
jgi:hypothetical protein